MQLRGRQLDSAGFRGEGIRQPRGEWPEVDAMRPGLEDGQGEAVRPAAEGVPAVAGAEHEVEELLLGWPVAERGSDLVRVAPMDR